MANNITFYGQSLSQQIRITNNNTLMNNSDSYRIINQKEADSHLGLLIAKDIMPAVAAEVAVSAIGMIIGSTCESNQCITSNE